MKIYKALLFLALITAACSYLWLSSCKHDSILPADTPEICFDSLVMPIFRNSCSTAGCHDGNSGESSWTLTTYKEVMNGITAFKPDQSQYYLRITGKGEGLMPPGRPLSIESRSIIRIWILQGADSTKCNIVPPVKK